MEWGICITFSAIIVLSFNLFRNIYKFIATIMQEYFLSDNQKLKKPKETVECKIQL